MFIGKSHAVKGVKCYLLWFIDVMLLLKLKSAFVSTGCARGKPEKINISLLMNTA